MNRKIKILNENKLIKWQEYAFLVAVILLPFNMVHENIKLFMFGQMSITYAIYPVLVGMGLWFYQTINFKYNVCSNKVKTYLVIFLAWQIISLIKGLIIFPYWNLLDIAQFNTLTKIANTIPEISDKIDKNIIAYYWSIIKFLYGIFIDTLFTLGVTIWLYTLFKSRSKQGLTLFRRGIATGATICFLYSIIEFAYIFGNDSAAELLKHINRSIYDIAFINGWYPVELLPGRIRSVTTEPSFLGIYLAVAIPIIGSYLFEKVRVKYLLLFMGLILLLIGTNSKTAIGLFLVQVFLSIIFLVIYKRKLFFYSKNIVKKILGSLIIVSVGIFVFNNYINQQEYKVKYQMLQYDSQNNTYKVKITNIGSKDWNEIDKIKIMRLWSTTELKNYQPVEVGQAVLARGQSIYLDVPVDNRPKLAKYVTIDLVNNNVYFADMNNNNLIIDLYNHKWINNDSDLFDKIHLYVRNNIYGIFDMQTGSNQARYGVISADMKIGYEYFFTGVGAADLKQGYMAAYFPCFALKSSEIKMWVKQSEQQGPFKSIYPILNEYSHVFAKNGFIGLILFCVPIVYIFYRLIKYRANLSVLTPLQVSIYIAFGGICTALFSNSANVMYCFWIMLAMIFLVNKDLKDDDI